jgi:ubiquinol-cytochrome c reductase cytochrome b subunit
MGGSFVVLAILPWLTPKLVIKSSVFRPITRILFWFILVDFILLGWIGQNVAEFPYIEIGQFLSIFYFLYFLVFLPVLSYFEYIFCIEGIVKLTNEEIL